MKKVITALTVLLGFASAMPTALCAQDPYDDLYYSPSKAAKQKKEQEKKLKEAIEAQTYNYTTVPTADYPAADTYSAGSSKPLNVDVDAYNRRCGRHRHAGRVRVHTSHRALPQPRRGHCLRRYRPHRILLQYSRPYRRKHLHRKSRPLGMEHAVELLQPLLLGAALEFRLGLQPVV